MITYNHEPYIAQAIEGVLQQENNFPIELVIGEDCSTDGTREIVFEYQKKYPEIIRVITSDKNVGACKNGLRTEKACRGKYIAFCEGDDYWHCPDKLQKQADYMESHPECAMVHSDGDCYYTVTGKRIRSIHKYRRRRPPDDPDISTMFLGKWGILTCTVCARRDLLVKIIDSDPILFQNGRFLMGDTPRWVELSCLGKMAYIDESLATLNVLAESASRSRDVVKLLHFSKSCKEMVLYLIDKYNLPATTRSRNEELWCMYALRLAFWEKNTQLGNEARKKLKRRFTVIEWLLFCGSQSRVLNHALRPLVHIYRFTRRMLWEPPHF
ncbi:MAG: glycosyltransferase, partial [Desulfobacteraceae bacterium]|nr:glycosyltransferase [Desulfobacteraceae bacterium]